MFFPLQENDEDSDDSDDDDPLRGEPTAAAHALQQH